MKLISRVCVAVLACAFALHLSAAPKVQKPVSLWKSVNEKSRLSGPSITDIDLVDMAVVVGEFNTVSVKDFQFSDLEESIKYAEGKRMMCVCSLRGSKMNAAKFASRMDKLKMNIDPKLSIYQDFGLSENEPVAGALPFYYATNAKGEVVYSGDSANEAIVAAGKAADAMPKDHPIFGQAVPVKLMAITNYFAEAELARPGMAYLKKMLGDKDPDTSAEARHFISAIEQKRLMNLKNISTLSETAPGQAAWKLEKFLKMWPEQKAHELVLDMLAARKEFPDQEKLVKIVLAVEHEAVKPVKKAMEAKKLAAFYQGNVTKLERLKKSKDPVAVDEATRYVSRVAKLAADMKAWQPPAPPAPPAAAAAAPAK